MTNTVPVASPAASEDKLRSALRRPTLAEPPRSVSGSDADWVRNVVAAHPVSRFRLAYEGLQSVLSILFRFMGVLFIFTAPLMWLWPNGTADVNAVTLKWGVSMFLMLSGLALFMRNHEDSQPEVEFDTDNREMRICQRDTKGRWEINVAYPFDGLSAIRMFGRVVQVETDDGSVVLRMRLRDRGSEDVLRSLLADEFPGLAT